MTQPPKNENQFWARRPSLVKGGTCAEKKFLDEPLCGDGATALLAFDAVQQKRQIPRQPRIVRKVSALRAAIGGYRAEGCSIALVPTMGALHAGHLALVRLARRRARRVVVSIFVNPAQFAPHEDLTTYPRTLASDLAALAHEKVDLVWAPAVETMYPAGFASRIVPEGAAAAGLEDAFRPHFFAGVATVVGKLLIQCLPDFAIFGEKDFQQLKVVTQLAKDLDIPVKIVGASTVREKDGLALSSRNAYLSPVQRAVAPALYGALKIAAHRIAAGELIARVMADGRAELARAGFSVDYFEARDAQTLAPVSEPGAGKLRLLAAAKLGSTRLIDNIKA
jgi:pantoate--beta-alanine ligase